MFICKMNCRTHFGLINGFFLREISDGTTSLANLIWTYLWAKCCVLFSCAWMKQNFQPLSLSTSHFQKQWSLKYKGVVFASHPKSEQDISISLDWLQVMLSGMQEIIKTNLSSKAFFDSRSESICKTKLFLFYVFFQGFSLPTKEQVK